MHGYNWQFSLKPLVFRKKLYCLTKVINLGILTLAKKAKDIKAKTKDQKSRVKTVNQRQKKSDSKSKIGYPRSCSQNLSSKINK